MTDSPDETLVVTDVLDADRVAALAGVLETRDAPTDGEPLPLLWHVGSFLPRPPQSALGPDGHPLVGWPSPPAAGLRRMFAGGRVELRADLPVGATATARTSVVSSREKEGRAGTMTLVTTRTDVEVDGVVAVVEERDIVYLQVVPGGGAAAPEGSARTPEGDRVLTVAVDPTLLFRFSALTYNAHRIHYDREYARDVEGHPGLVVHGPLQAVLMAEVGTGLAPSARGTFAYRLVSPLHEGRGLHVVGDRTDDGAAVRVVDDLGTVTAQATWRPSADD